jgi:DUF1680 family protein
VAVKRTWKTGDVVEVDIPMELRVVPLPNAPQYAAFMHGPIVLAGALGSEGITPGSDLIRSEHDYGTVLKSSFEPPRIVGDATKLLDNISPVPGDSQSFKTVGQQVDVRLVPYYRIAHERYCIYWKIAEA